MTPTLSHRLGIDFGTTHTVAVIETADAGGVRAAQPLLFDSSPLLSSAVFADPDGRLLTGRDGDRSARLDPTRYEPNPKRRIDEASILLGNDEFPVSRIISAVLTRVVAEAIRATGGMPAQTVLTHPANWGSRRKDVLVHAAAAAGLASVTVVPEPVAAAAHFTGVLGRRVNPGEALAVYDFGAGTFDASIVRQRPDGAWDLVASEGLGDVGGLDLDAVLVEQIGRVLGSQDPQRWHQLANPGDTMGRRASRTFWDDVRAAKEQLSRTPTAAVHVPLFDTDTHLTREQFEAAARPLLDRTVELMAALLRRAGQMPLAGLYLVGGSSRIPLIATLLHQRLGVAPTLIDTPELLVAQGSLRTVPAGPAFAKTATFPAVPAGPPGVVPPGFGASTTMFAPPGAPVSTPPMPGGPVSAPTLGMPTSGIPISGAGADGPPSGEFGGPLPPPPPAGMPLWGSTMPGGPGAAGMGPYGGPPPSGGGYPGQPGHPGRAGNANRGGGKLKLILAGVAAFVLLASGGAVAATKLASGDDKDPAGNSAADKPNVGGQQPGPAAGDEAEATGPGRAATLKVDKAVWYEGKKITVSTVKYDPALKEDQLQIDITMENLGTDGNNGAASTDAYFAYDGAITRGNVEEIQTLPGKATSNGKFVFRMQKPVTDLKKGVLTIGRSDHVQPTIPLGDLDKSVTLEPKKLAGPTEEMRSGVLGMKLQICEQRADNPHEHTHAKKDYMMVVCVVDVKSYKQSIYDHGVWKENYLLKLPDGTTTGPERADNALLNSNEQAQGVSLNFLIRWPAPGAYAFQFYDAGRLGNDAPDAERPVKEVPMTLT